MTPSGMTGAPHSGASHRTRKPSRPAHASKRIALPASPSTDGNSPASALCGLAAARCAVCMPTTGTRLPGFVT